MKRGGEAASANALKALPTRRRCAGPAHVTENRRPPTTRRTHAQAECARSHLELLIGPCGAPSRLGRASTSGGLCECFKYEDGAAASAKAQGEMLRRGCRAVEFGVLGAFKC